MFWKQEIKWDSGETSIDDMVSVINNKDETFIAFSLLCTPNLIYYYFKEANEYFDSEVEIIKKESPVIVSCCSKKGDSGRAVFV